MEMEKEILLASDGFYYDGVPSQRSYTSVTPNTAEDILDKDTKVAFKEIEAELIFSQITLVTVAVICLIKGVINSMNNKKMASTENDLNGDINNTEKSLKKATVPYYIASIIFFIGYGIINIIKGFIANIM